MLDAITQFIASIQRINVVYGKREIDGFEMWGLCALSFGGMVDAGTSLRCVGDAC